MAEKPMISPLGDRCVIRPLTDEEKGMTTPSGIIIAETKDSDKDGSEQGVVVAIGPGRLDEDGEKLMPMGVHEGDRVLFPRFAGEKVRIGTDEYHVVSEQSILGVIK